MRTKAFKKTMNFLGIEQADALTSAPNHAYACFLFFISIY